MVKSLTRYLNGDILLTLIVIIIFPKVIAMIFQGKALFVIAPLGLVLGGVFLVSIKDALFYSYLLSPFIGFTIWGKMNMGVTLTDVIFPLFAVVSFVSPARFGDNKPLTMGEKHISFSLFLLCLIGLLSFFFNSTGLTTFHVVESLWFIYRALQVFYTFWYLTKVKDNIVMIATLEKLLIGAMVIQLPLIVLQYLYFNVGIDNSDRYQFGTMAHHHSVIAMFCVTFIPLFLRRVEGFKLKFKNVLWISLALFLLVVIFLSETRSIILGLVGAFVLIIVGSFRFNKKSLYIVLSSCIVAVFVWFLPITQTLIEETFHSNHTSGVDGSAYSRLLIWKGAWDSIAGGTLLEKLFGHGIGLYETIEYDLVIWGGAKSAMGAHNNYLHVLAEMGGLGLLVFLYHFFTISVLFFRKRKSSPVSYFFLIATISLLISGMTQETFWYQKAFGSYWNMYVVVLYVVLHIDRAKRESS